MHALSNGSHLQIPSFTWGSPDSTNACYTQHTLYNWLMRKNESKLTSATSRLCFTLQLVQVSLATCILPHGMERVQAVRERLCTPRGSPSPRRPLTAEVLKGDKGENGNLQGDLQRLLKTPRVFHRCQGISHIKRNELRANLLPCILQTPSSDREETDVERSEKFKKRLDYQNIIGTRSESESEVNEIAFLEKTIDFPEEWDPAWQAVNSCDSLKDLVHERCSRFRRPIEGMVNTSSDLPFLHKAGGREMWWAKRVEYEPANLDQQAKTVMKELRDLVFVVFHVY